MRHHNAPALLRDIRENAEARALFDGRCATGMSFAKGHLWRYHSEYADWSDGGSADEARLTSIVRTGTEHFERMFGFQSSSTIPPHYVVSDAAFRVWKSMGIRYVQGSNYQIHAGVGGAKLIRSRYLGQRETSGMLLMGRNVKFEPRPGRKESVQKAVAQAGQMFAARIPVVVDTHRINYTGQFRAEGLAALRQLVMALDSYKPLYLTTAELAEAIDAGGPFRDSFTKSERALTPLATVRQYAARKLA